jgi:hypothetical protein
MPRSGLMIRLLLLLPSRQSGSRRGEIVEEVDESVPTAQAALCKLKSSATVMLGRVGGQGGGRTRAAKLNAEERREIARRAAVARRINDG